MHCSQWSSWLTATLAPPASLSHRVLFGQESLDLLALGFTLVKILYLAGAAAAVGDVVACVEPTRRASRKPIHATNVRNEQAYYCCAAQCLAVRSARGLTTAVPPEVPAAGKTTVFVCGDSHALSPAWMTAGSGVVLVPKLVTGLKHWHLRPDSNFYPKVSARLGP